MANIQGRNLMIYVNGIPVGCSKTATLQITVGTSDSTSKCDVKNGVLFANNTPQVNTWTMTDSGIVPILNSAGTPTSFSLSSLANIAINQTKVYVTFTGSGGILYGGDAWATSVQASAAFDADLTYDVTFTGQGPLVAVPVS